MTRYAAMRDASFYSAHTSYASRYHVVKQPETDEISECGVVVFAFHRSYREAIPIELVPPRMRCMRPGCRKFWT